jgi:hypothetical protein
MRSAPLTTIKGGINRLRTKGGARADTLYDLLNGYVTESGTVKARPGTARVAELDSRTRGLCAFGGELHVFCHTQVEIPEGYVLNILTHPDPPIDIYAYTQDYNVTDTGVELKTIHFAEPFMGGLYVVAEFQDDSVFHYWLQPGTEWEASTVYAAGDLIQPTTPNGLLYRATRLGDPNQPWQPGELRFDGINDAYAQSVVEPTTYNGFYYVCIETQGSNPRSGSTEPVWPTYENGQVIERTDTGVPDETTIDSPPPPPAGGDPTGGSGGDGDGGGTSGGGGGSGGGTDRYNLVNLV